MKVLFDTPQLLYKIIPAINEDVNHILISYLKESVNLINIIANEQWKLYKTFSKSQLSHLLHLTAVSSVGLLEIENQIHI